MIFSSMTWLRAYVAAANRLINSYHRHSAYYVERANNANSTTKWRAGQNAYWYLLYLEGPWKIAVLSNSQNMALCCSFRAGPGNHMNKRTEIVSFGEPIDDHDKIWLMYSFESKIGVVN